MPRFSLKGIQLKPQREVKYLRFVLDDINSFVDGDSKRHTEIFFITNFNSS